MKRVTKIFMAIIAFTLGVETVVCDETLELSVQEAVLTALENNSSISIERLKPRIAGTYARAEGAAFEPALSASASETWPDDSKKRQYQASLGLSLPTGTEISAGASCVGDLGISEESWTGKVFLSVNQALLKGLHPIENLARLRKAKLDVQISELELKAISERLVASVEGAYWNRFLAIKELEIRERSLELARKQLSESEERIRVGKLAEIELAAVHAEVAVRQEALIDAKNRGEQARLNLIHFLNPPVVNLWDLNIILSDSLNIPPDSVEQVEVHEALAMRFRPDLLQAKISAEKNRLDLIKTRSGLLPRLDLFVSLGKTSYSSSFENSLPSLAGEDISVSGSLNLQLPITQKQARAEFARTRWTKEQLEIALENLERLAQKDVRLAYSEVFRAKQQVEATESASRLHVLKLEAEQEKFRVGKSTNFQVLQAQRDLIESQLSRARAKTAYLSALVNLYLSEGTLLERRGIEN